METQIKVGDVLYKEHKDKITELTVIKVGAKYLYVDGIDYAKKPIDKVTLEYVDKVYSRNNFQLYRSIEEIQDLKEKNLLLQKFYEHFYRGKSKNNTLKQLQEAAKILGI